MRRFEHYGFISGLGQSAVGRRLGRSALDLTAEACLTAIADAGENDSYDNGIYFDGTPEAVMSSKDPYIRRFLT